ncbi:MAG: tryptophan 2,3-dioxygenase family protein [Thermoflexibacter sp.]
MNNNDIPSHILAQVEKLEQKYEAMGQDLSSYLDGLLYANYLTYWDYIHLDTLLSLQNPKTDFPDEQIFIIYHQITELYFKLILLEIKQITKHDYLTEDFFTARLKRINRYLAYLVHTFEIMGEGMEREQFLKFRMSLLPASGFQSGQFRMIEICATDFKYLVEKNFFKQIDTHTTIEEMYEHIYWKYGATELATGKKTLTLKQFEDKYAEAFIRLAKEHIETNFLRLFKRKFSQSESIKSELRKFDALLNIDWKLAHFGSAVRYLHKEPADIAATGGTNWQKYLPPRFQKIIFFPELWTEEEKENWGKSWVVERFGKGSSHR